MKLDSEAETPKSSFSWFWEAVLVITIIGMVIGIVVPNFIHGGTSKLNGIVSYHLRQIDAAKQQWAKEHGVTNAAAFSRAIKEKDLAPYLLSPFTKSKDFGNPAFGEIYLIRDLNRSPEAVLTRKLTERNGDSLPRGTVIRLDQMPESDGYELILPGGTSKIYRWRHGILTITNR